MLEWLQLDPYLEALLRNTVLAPIPPLGPAPDLPQPPAQTSAKYSLSSAGSSLLTSTLAKFQAHNQAEALQRCTGPSQYPGNSLKSGCFGASGVADLV